MGKGGFKSVRMAPEFKIIKFTSGKFNPEEKPYNAESIGRFLKWPLTGLLTWRAVVVPYLLVASGGFDDPPHWVLA